LGAAWYALKATQSSDKSVAAERNWQDEELAPGIRELVLTAREADRFNKI
jgi:SRSO17 transposase